MLQAASRRLYNLTNELKLRRFDLNFARKHSKQWTKLAQSPPAPARSKAGNQSLHLLCSFAQVSSTCLIQITLRPLTFPVDIVVLFPIQIPIPRRLSEAIQNSPTLHDLGVISLKSEGTQLHEIKDQNSRVLKFPLNFVTAPLIADLFLLAVRAIGRQEVHDGILGANNILPYNIMIFFLTLAYIAISIDCSGLIRWLAVTVLQKGGKRGRVLFLLLYIFFFVLGSFIGNDPIVLSGTAFLAYMTRIAPNIKHPRAWIHTQFAVANIASAILVSSNPTNLVLAGAFGIKFITYTANMVVPVFVTIIVLFPFLLYMIFHEENLIPLTIKVRKLTPKEKAEKPLDPKIPDSREIAESQGDDVLEVLHPFIDWYSAVVGAFIMSATLVTLLVLNASDQKHGGRERPVFYVTLPGAFVMFCWDLGWGWRNRKETRLIAQKGFEAKEARRAQQIQQEAQEMVQEQQMMSTASREEDQEQGLASMHVAGECLSPNDRRESRIVRFVRRSRATFPTVTEVLKLLPYALLPFAFSMFILVQGLVSKGWVAVFAFGWDYVRNFLNYFPLSVSFKLRQC
jgi:Na+/H+ antiporter NhaD/arsenite permease-like protein